MIFFSGCRNRKENTTRPDSDIPAQQEQLRDSNNSIDTPGTQIPNDQVPGRAKKNTNTALDTLRPIKA